MKEVGPRLSGWVVYGKVVHARGTVSFMIEELRDGDGEGPRLIQVFPEGFQGHPRLGDYVKVVATRTEISDLHGKRQFVAHAAVWQKLSPIEMLALPNHVLEQL